MHKLVLAGLVCWKDTGVLPFSISMAINRVASFFAPPSLSIFHPKFLPTLQCRLQSPVASLSFWTPASCSNYSRCHCSSPEPIPRPKPAVLDTCTHQLCWEKLNISLPCLGEVLAEHTCMCCNYFIGPCFPFLVSCLLPSLCSPPWTGSGCQAWMQPRRSPVSARHGYTPFLLFLLLKGEAKIARGTCIAKIPEAFWPASGMALFMKLFPGSPVDLGNGKLALPKGTAPKYSCCVAGLVSWSAQGRQAGSCLGYWWHMLAENPHCTLALIWLCLVLISRLASACLGFWSSRLRLWYSYREATARVPRGSSSQQNRHPDFYKLAVIFSSV